jgi:4-amino-4-deoxy-L-arabinose transferase-like glycosyltransferase
LFWLLGLLVLWLLLLIWYILQWLDLNTVFATEGAVDRVQTPLATLDGLHLGTASPPLNTTTEDQISTLMGQLMHHQRRLPGISKKEGLFRMKMTESKNQPLITIQRGAVRRVSLMSANVSRSVLPSHSNHKAVKLKD